MNTKLKNKNKWRLFSIVVFALGIIHLSSCDKESEGKLFQVYEEYMLDEIMTQKDQLSDFLKVIDKAEFRGTIHAYGAYTIFAPTNDGIKTYLAKIGKTSVDGLTKQEAESMVKYHMILDTLSTSSFVDGRLISPTFTKRYLTSKAESDGNKVSYVINRQAKIVDGNLLAANGYLHVVDNVLMPPVNTITDQIRGLSPDYSLMKEIFEKSGYATLLSTVEEDKWYTFFVQDDEAFNRIGINSIGDLVSRLKVNSPEIADNETALLRNYIAYHTIPSLNYVADLLSKSSALTLAERQAITFKREQDKILLNEFIQNGEKEEGVELNRTSLVSDNSCANGVIHLINGNIEIKKRKPYRVYWDLAEQPEIMALKTFRRNPSPDVRFYSGDLSEIKWEGGPGDVLTYVCSSMAFNSKAQYAYADYLTFRLGFTTIKWMELTTPVLVEGKYKVWFSYRTMGKSGYWKPTFKQEGFDEQLLNIITPQDYTPSLSSVGYSHDALEIAGWKQYTARVYDTAMACSLVGIIDVKTTGRHTIRLEPTNNGGAGNYDMFQFIPVDEDQQWPRVDMKGKLIYSDTPSCEIFGNTPCE